MAAAWAAVAGCGRSALPLVPGDGSKVADAAAREALLDPETCGSCHTTHYNDWRQSMHARAADDPVFVAMNARGQRETHGAMGDFCVKCHAPMAVREGATHDGLNLADVPAALKGVTCYFCHNVSEVAGTHNNPLKLADDTTMRGGIRDPIANEVHQSAYSPLHDRERLSSSATCGACHDIQTGHGADIERTFQEWHTSAFNSPAGSTCGQCHMTLVGGPQPVANLEGLPDRPLHSHLFPAVDVVEDPLLTGRLARANQEFLDSTLQAALCVKQVAGSFALRVVVDNVAAGHSFPSGSAQDRRTWFEVVAYDKDRVLLQSGRTDQVAAMMRAPDDDLWMVRDCMFDAVGGQVAMFWDAAKVASNTLPTLSTFDRNSPAFYGSHRVQSYPRDKYALVPGTPDRVTLRVRLQPIGQDVLEDLVQSGDLDAEHAKAPPIYDLAATTLTWTRAQLAEPPSFDEGGPVWCVATGGFNAAAGRQPAAARPGCRP